ncbi:hypothetical protein AgCh_028601 [Apium graveolens]
MTKVEKLLNGIGKSLKDFPNMPYPEDIYMHSTTNRLIEEETGHDKNQQFEGHSKNFHSLNSEQLEVYNSVLEAVNKGEGDTDSELAAADLLKSGSGIRFTQKNTLFHRFTIFVMSSALSLRSILDAHKLTGPNFANWLRNLRIVLRVEKLEYVLDSPKPTKPASDAHNDEHVVYRKWIDDANVAQCIMLASMNIELQKQHEHMDAHTILMHLQELYDVAGRIARYEISKELFGCRMSDGSSVNDHVLKMINLIERLGQLGFSMDEELSQDLVFQSLPSSFSQFVVNFHIKKLDVSLPELHNMLKITESNFPPKKSFVLLIGEDSNPKNRKKNPSKKKKVNEKKPIPPKAEDPKSKAVCFHCNKVGHWKRNCKVYLVELKKKKGSETTASDSGMFMIEVNMSLSQISTWVLDTACGSHICNSLQGLRRSRTLEEDEVILRMGNGARVAAEAIGSFHLHMPTGKTIVLNDCYFVPSISNLWNHCKVFVLHQNIRLGCVRNAEENQKIAEFAKWVLDVGDSKVQDIHPDNIYKDPEIIIPWKYLVEKKTNTVKDIVDVTYPDFTKNYTIESYLKERAILTPTNAIVHEVC